MKQATTIAVLASGSGTNAENIIRYFAHSKKAKVVLVLTNNPSAGVINRAKNLNVPCVVFNKNDFSKTDTVLNLLTEYKTDLIVLAGFLLLVPEKIIRAFQNKIINIHPALLPEAGGKGFYGERVHRAVLDTRHPVSGITIHYVNEKFDEGEIIFQAACHVSKEDTIDSLASKIHSLEYMYFPVVIEKISGIE